MATHSLPLRLFVIALILGGVALGSRADDAAPAWQEIAFDDGIRVFKRDIPGQELPGFRGETVIRAPLEALAAELKDHAHHKDWMHHCVDSKRLTELGPDHGVDYNRTDAPWPVWDRDVVLDARWTTSDDGRLVVLAFKNTNAVEAPLPAKTVRMPRLEGFYRFWKLGPDRTKVVYQVEADPGGSLPTWLAKSVARDLPYNTLAALRARVTKH